MNYDRSRICKTAHAQWRAVRGRPGWDFARCMRLAWAVEKKRVAGPEYYNPDPDRPRLDVIGAALFLQAGRQMNALLAAGTA